MNGQLFISSNKTKDLSINANDNYIILYPGETLKTHALGFNVEILNFKFHGNCNEKKFIANILKGVDRTFSLSAVYDDFNGRIFHENFAYTIDQGFHSLKKAKKKYQFSSGKQQTLVIEHNHIFEDLTKNQPLKNDTDNIMIIYNAQSQLTISKEYVDSLTGEDKKGCLEACAEDNAQPTDPKALEKRTDLNFKDFTVTWYLPDYVTHKQRETYQGPFVFLGKYGKDYYTPNERPMY